MGFEKLQKLFVVPILILDVCAGEVMAKAVLPANTHSIRFVLLFQLDSFVNGLFIWVIENGVN